MANEGLYTQLVNLYTEMETRIDKEFETKSYTESMTDNGGWSWDGVETITIPTTSHFELNDYDLTQPWYQRTGAVQEVYDQMNSYTVRRKRSFHGFIDDVPSMDQKFIRKMAVALKETTDEELIPENDKYRLLTWANGAGNVVFGTADETKAKKGANDEDIIRTLLTLNAVATNKRVPTDGRTFVMSITDAIETRLSERLQYNQNYTGQMVRGEVAVLGDAKIVAIPDDLMPAGVKIMMKWKGSTADPRKAHKIRTLNNVVGSFGTHAEGLFRYDSFVKAQKANGILLFGLGTAASPNGYICDTPIISDYSSGFTITMPTSTAIRGVVSGVTIKYIISPVKMFFNPKVHEGATAYDDTITISTAGTFYVTAYAEKAGCISSGIARKVITVT